MGDLAYFPWYSPEVIAAAQRKPTSMHDTHGQYNKMPKLSPAELSRMKAEKDIHESAIARKRADEARQQLQQQMTAQQQQQQQRLQQTQNVIESAFLEDDPVTNMYCPRLDWPNSHDASA